MNSRAAITGIGIVSSIGCDLRSFRQALFAGRSGVTPLPDSRGFLARAAAQVAAFQPPRCWENSDRSVQFAIAAARSAVNDARIDLARVAPDTIGVSVASSKGGVTSFCKLHEVFIANGGQLRGGQPDGGQLDGHYFRNLFVNCWPSMPATAVAAEFGCHGPTSVPVAACAAGSHAIIEGAGMIERGEAEVVFAGATEASITPLIVAGFCNLGVLAGDGICRPFDANRSGFVIGEGAAVLVLENAQSAAARGARIYADIAGCARAADASGIVALDESGASVATAIRLALARAGVTPEQVSCINAHATGTRLNDVLETRAIKAALGRHARNVPISGTKPITGHLLGAAGAIETAICAVSMHDSMIPPTINLATPDPECDLDYVPGKARRLPVNVAVSLSFGFGGQIGVIVLSK